MDSFVTEAFTLLAVGIIIVGLRTYARWSSVGLQGLKFDDYLMLFAVVSTNFPCFMLPVTSNIRTKLAQYIGSQQSGCLLLGDCYSLCCWCVVAGFGQ